MSRSSPRIWCVQIAVAAALGCASSKPAGPDPASLAPDPRVVATIAPEDARRAVEKLFEANFDVKAKRLANVQVLEDRLEFTWGAAPQSARWAQFEPVVHGNAQFYWIDAKREGGSSYHFRFAAPDDAKQFAEAVAVLKNAAGGKKP